MLPLFTALALASTFLAGPAAAQEPAPVLQLSYVSPSVSGDPLPFEAIPQSVAPGLSEEPPLPQVDLHKPLRLRQAIDLTATHADLWERIRHGFSMPDLDNDLVERQQVWLLNRPDYIQRVVERSRMYLFHIVEEIERRGMPTELALLPIVESAYNPMALSTAKAAGLWQFIPSTGKVYNLKQNWWVDERRDIVASTSAALDYLQKIYEMHGDWQLALASYNWGEGAVGRAIEKNQKKGLPTDYSSLRMPKETQHYVPKLQALKNLVNSPELWGVLDIPSIPNEPYFVTIDKPADMDIKIAAELAEMPVREFVALNPAHNRPVIKEDLPLVLPAEKVDVFFRNLEQNNDPLTQWQAYTFQKKDKLESVAARFGLSLAKLKEVNGLGRKSRVRPGQSLLVPARGLAAMNARLDSFNPPPVAESKVAKKRGGSTSTQSRRGTKPTTLANKSPAKPQINPKASKKTDKPAFARYTVKPGDTVSSIARQFKVSPQTITRHNRVKAGLKAGQVLLVAQAG